MDIRDPFTIERDGRSFTDAIYYTVAEWEALTDAEVEANREARFAAWLAIVTTPPVVAEPTQDELLGQLGDLNDQVAAISDQMNDIAGQIDPDMVDATALATAITDTAQEVADTADLLQSATEGS